MYDFLTRTCATFISYMYDFYLAVRHTNSHMYDFYLAGVRLFITHMCDFYLVHVRLLSTNHSHCNKEACRQSSDMWLRWCLLLRSRWRPVATVVPGYKTCGQCNDLLLRWCPLMTVRTCGQGGDLWSRWCLLLTVKNCGQGGVSWPSGRHGICNPNVVGSNPGLGLVFLEQGA